MLSRNKKLFSIRIRHSTIDILANASSLAARELRQPVPGIATEISRQLELAMLLEVSAYPKPGNVHRTRDYSDTRFEHYLASAVAARLYFERAARTGNEIAERKSPASTAQVGTIIRDAVVAIMQAQHGGNTSLGTVTLFVPLAVAAGMTLTNRRYSLALLRDSLGRILESTTVADAVAFYEAVGHAKPAGMGTVPYLDVKDRTSIGKILRGEHTLLEIFRLAADRDSICSEWVTRYRTTFQLGYPFLKRELSRTHDINKATVNTYLVILSKKPDTLIARKVGMRKAMWVSERAKKALALGGATTSAGRREIEQLDEDLRIDGHMLNPGSTADISACVVALAIISGYRP